LFEDNDGLYLPVPGQSIAAWYWPRSYLIVFRQMLAGISKMKCNCLPFTQHFYCFIPLDMGSGCSLAHLIGPSLLLIITPSEKQTRDPFGPTLFDAIVHRLLTRAGISPPAFKSLLWSTREGQEEKHPHVSWCAGMRAISKNEWWSSSFFF
jgi:hypothetical protein